MRLSYGEIVNLASVAYSKTVELAVKDGFDIEGDYFHIKQEHIFADLVADEVTQKIRSNIQWVLDKDE